MQIGAPSWGQQQWTAPTIDGRTAGVTGRGEDASGVGGVDPSDRGQQWGNPAVEARTIGTARKGDANRKSGGADGVAATGSPKGCQTCKRRKYTDRSSDPTVSFQTPTSLSPGAAPTAVRAHEQEHVVHEQARARENGLRVISQSVTIHYGICPECGRPFVSGGTTSTTTKPAEARGSYTSSGASGGSSAGALVNRLA
jgi:hypothetical protein